MRFLIINFILFTFSVSRHFVFLAKSALNSDFNFIFIILKNKTEIKMKDQEPNKTDGLDKGKQRAKYKKAS